MIDDTADEHSPPATDLAFSLAEISSASPRSIYTCNSVPVRIEEENAVFEYTTPTSPALENGLRWC